jgi:hypothetical protein
VTRPSTATPEPARQLSLLAADVAPPSLDDLEGLLCGPAHVVRGFGGQAGAARISVLVDEPWRVAALEARLAELGLLDASRPAPTAARPDAVSVRTRFDARLLPVAERWTRGATLIAPAALRLDGPRLWWWAVAAGTSDRGSGGVGFRLRLAASAPQRWPAVGAALAEAGVPGIFLGPRADGPAYRLVGARRLARLVDLVGEAPAGAPPLSWPSATIPSGRSAGARSYRRVPNPTRTTDDSQPAPPPELPPA